MQSEDIVYRTVNLQNDSNAEMAVDGSETPVIFQFDPEAGETWYLDQIKLLLLDTGDMSNDSFGSITALTNGVNIGLKLDGFCHCYSLIKDNADVVLSFPEQGLVGASATGFLSEEDFYVGIFKLPIPLRFHGDDDDAIMVTVQDDLTNIGRFRMSALLRKPV